MSSVNGDCFVGLDCGTSVVKVAAFDMQGEQLAVSQQPLAGLSPQPGWMEYRAEDLWAAVAGAMRGLFEEEGLCPERIIAVGPTGAGNGVLLLDAEDRPVRNGIFALDNRAGRDIESESSTDLPRLTRALNGQTTWTGQTFYLLKWLREHEPSALEQAHRVFVIKDYVKYCLTGRYAGDRSEQSKLGLLDLHRDRPTAELMDLYGLGDLRRRLPPLEPSTAIIGGVTAQAARATGLQEGTAVVNGLADVDASALGAGVVQAGQVSVVAGTWSINQLLVDEPVIRPEVFGLSHYAIDGVYEYLEASPSSTANLTWFIRQTCGDLVRSAEGQDAAVYERINRMVASVPPASTEVFFHPYLYGSNEKVNARAGFYNLAGWHDRAHLLAALFEGVVFSHNHHVEKLRRLGEGASEVRLSGGAAHSEVWTQMFADVLGLPVSVPEAEEVGALGAAMCAAVGAGHCSDLVEASRRMVRLARSHRPRAELHERYCARYRGYEVVTAGMEPIWDELRRAFGARDAAGDTQGG